MAADPHGRDAGDGCPWFLLAIVAIVVLVVKVVRREPHSR